MSLVKLLCVCILCAGFANAGFEYGTCPDDEAIIPCDYDCKTNHGAGVGTCTYAPDWNCICSGNKTANNTCTYFNSCTTIPLACQCATNQLTQVVTDIYAYICDTDCRCTHGGASGTCDWGWNQCICSYPDGFTWTNETCPALVRAAIYDPDQQISNIFNVVGIGNPVHGLC